MDSLSLIEEKIKSEQRNAQIYAAKDLLDFLLNNQNEQLFQKAYQYLLKICTIENISEMVFESVKIFLISFSISNLSVPFSSKIIE